MTVIVEKHTASAVAEHYGLDARAFRRWIRRNQNVHLLGTLDSPAMQSTVERFRLCGSWDNRELCAAYDLNVERGVIQPNGSLRGAEAHVFHIVNEYRGRGLAAKSQAIPLKTCICAGKVLKPRANCWADAHNLKGDLS